MIRAFLGLVAVCVLLAVGVALLIAGPIAALGRWLG